MGITDAIVPIFPAASPTVYAGQRLNHRESGGTADAPDLGSGARKGVGVRLSPLAPLRPADLRSGTPKLKPWSKRRGERLTLMITDWLEESRTKQRRRDVLDEAGDRLHHVEHRLGLGALGIQARHQLDA
jgi:hypothetical protein